jgi:hypothetical protein
MIPGPEARTSVATKSSSDPGAGRTLPPFRLLDPRRGTALTERDLAASPGVLVMVLCNHCPYVRHIEEGILSCAREYGPRGIAILGVSANDPETYPEDAPEKLAERARARGYPFPYLHDVDQSFVRALGAECTPEFFLYDAGRRLYYHGRFDGATPGNREAVTGRELRAAMDALLAGRPAPVPQIPSVGCSIKWRA